jgi:hypothetical protein
VGLLSLASIFFGPQKFIETKYRKCMFAGVLAFAIGLILYFIVRILYWTNLNNLVMIISANNLNIDSNSPTYISALNNAAIGQMGRDATQNWLINLAVLTNYLWMLLPAILLAFPIDFFLNFNLFKNKLKTMFKNKPKTTIALASITGVISAIAVYLVQTFYYNPQWTILLIIVAVVVIIDVVLLIIKLNKSARLLFYSIKVRLG